MNKLIKKITIALSSLTIVTSTLAAPAGSVFSRIAQETSITASAWDDLKFLDSTGTVYVKLDNCFVKNGKSSATRAMITGVASGKIKKGVTFEIPGKVVVSGKDYNGKSFTVEVPVTTIGSSAFQNQSLLTSVKFPSSNISIAGGAFQKSGLTSLTLPSTVTGVASGAFQDCDGLKNVNFSGKQPPITAFIDCDNLTKFNNKAILSYKSDGEPVLNSTVLNEVYAIDSTYITIEKCPCISQYMNDYINYIVRTNTNTSDSDLVKAKKLHNWLINRTEYDQENGNNFSISEESWSPFLHRKSDNKFYAVCAGYAGAYKLLLDAAGVECYKVYGNKINPGDVQHEWNIVKINGNFYHVDTTWDDGKQTISYANFMRSDANFAKTHDYNWEVTINGVKKTRSSVIAPYDLSREMYALGDVNGNGIYSEKDATMIQQHILHTLKLNTAQLARADVNLDGEVSMPDAITIAMAVTKMQNADCLYTKSMFEFIYYEGNVKV